MRSIITDTYEGSGFFPQKQPTIILLLKTFYAIANILLRLVIFLFKTI